MCIHTYMYLQVYTDLKHNIIFVFVCTPTHCPFHFNHLFIHIFLSDMCAIQLFYSEHHDDVVLISSISSQNDEGCGTAVAGRHWDHPSIPLPGIPSDQLPPFLNVHQQYSWCASTDKHLTIVVLGLWRYPGLFHPWGQVEKLWLGAVGYIQLAHVGLTAHLDTVKQII